MPERLPARIAALALAALALADLSCHGAGDRKTASDAAPARAAKGDRGWPGKVIPREATTLNAPMNYARFKGWRSWSSWTKIVDLAKDGERVEAGKEVARFEFTNEEALPYVSDQVSVFTAQRAERQTGLADERRKRDAARSRAELSSEQADLDTQKKGLVSNRDLELLQIAAKRADAELAAASLLAGATGAMSAAELASIDANLRDWKAYRERYDFYEKRTHILAPHAGIVRHGYLGFQRRKVQKPDDMPNGYPFAFVAKDERLAIEFYVPEHRLAEVVVGKGVQARLPDDERRVAATVLSIDPFPQEMGFLRGDDELPDAREKAFVVTAELAEPPARFSSGIEVRVEP